LSDFQAIPPLAIDQSKIPVEKTSTAALARDVLTMGVGTALAALFNTAVVFLIPRIVSVQDFGYWRLFMLYSGYAGLLQMGFLDGALLRWAGQPLESFRPQIQTGLKFLVGQLSIVLIPGAAFVCYVFHGPIRFVGLSVLAFAFVFNVTALLQYGLQGARQFRPVAIASATPVGIFVVLTLAFGFRRTPGFHLLIVLYCLAWTGALVYLWVRLRPLRGAPADESAWSVGKMYLFVGWPIVLANVGFGFVQTADRLVVSWTLPLREFAQYSLASSAMFVPITAIAAVYRVFFSHAAALQAEGRAKIYGHASRFMLMAWSLLVPYFFLLEIVVKQYLPKYSSTLPVAAVLLLGVFFIAEIQILHVSFAYIYGKQRQFLLLTMAALMVAFALDMTMALRPGSLVAIATGQLIALVLWWCANEWMLRKETAQPLTNQIALIAVFAWSAVSYGIALRSSNQVGIRILIYYAMVLVFLAVACSAELRIVWRLLTPTRSQPVS